MLTELGGSLQEGAGTERERKHNTGGKRYIFGMGRSLPALQIVTWLESAASPMGIEGGKGALGGPLLRHFVQNSCIGSPKIPSLN